MELREKLPKVFAHSKEGSAGSEAVSALINLGYKKSLSEKAVETAVKNGADSIENIIKEALKYLTGTHKSSIF